MGKQHSDNTSGRRGRNSGNDRPERGAAGAKTGRFGNNDRPTGNRSGNKEEGRRGGDFSSRPSFGRPEGGSNRNSGRDFGGSRNSGGSSSRDFGAGRSAGSGRDFSNRGFGAGRSNDRRDDRRGSSDNRSEGYGRREQPESRPVRAYEAKANWPGQPYRQEGQAAVPRGERGERNRKFQKANPFEEAKPFRPQPEAPARPSRDEATGTDRPIRAARPFDFRGRPEGTEERNERPVRAASQDRNEARGSSRSDHREPRESRSFGDRKPVGGAFGKRESGNSRDARPHGGRPERNVGGGSQSFGELRAKRNAESSERRSGTTTDKRFTDASANRAGKLRRGEVEGQAPDYKNLKHYEADRNRGNKRRRNEEEFGTEVIRLNRYIANAGICSRREADSLIAAGEIRVNGEVVTEMGYQVQPSDTVQYGKTNLNREKLVYVLLNKPKDFITTTEDPEGRRTVMDLVAGASKERVFPVGRLDRNTTGLLLFTNDGEIAQKLSHPSHMNKKIYQVELDKPMTEADLRQISEGVVLEDGKADVDDVAVVAGNAHFVGVEIHIGRNRIVRRIFEHLGYDVVSLDRVQYAGLTKKDLPRGKWRFLTEKEVIRLKYFM